MFTVRINGVTRDTSGDIYSGAIIEYWLNSPIGYCGSLYGNGAQRVYSNAFGRFSFEVIPNSVSEDPESYYTFKVVKDTTNVYHKIVDGSLPEVNLEDLPEYIPPWMRPVFLGERRQRR